jgi:hypothetical protein
LTLYCASAIAPPINNTMTISEKGSTVLRCHDLGAATTFHCGFTAIVSSRPRGRHQYCSPLCNSVGNEMAKTQRVCEAVAMCLASYGLPLSH